MARPNYGPQAHQRARRLLEVLLAYVNNDINNCDSQQERMLQRIQSEVNP